MNTELLGGWFWGDKSLRNNKDGEKVLLVALFFMHEEGYLVPDDVEFIADHIRIIEKPFIPRYIGRLISKGYLKRIKKDNEPYLYLHYLAKGNKAKSMPEFSLSAPEMKPLLSFKERHGIPDKKSFLQGKAAKDYDNDLSKLHRIAEIWNEMCSDMPACLEMTEKRRKLCEAQWAAHPSDEYWINACALVNESPFLTGHNSRGWKPGFDFFIDKDKHIKIMEGQYRYSNGPEKKKKKGELVIIKPNSEAASQLGAV